MESPVPLRRLLATAAATVALAGCGGGDPTSLAELAEGVPSDAAVWVAMELDDPAARAFAKRVVGADPPNVRRIAIWVRFRPDGSAQTRLITQTPRRRGGLAGRKAFRELIGDVEEGAEAAGFYDPKRLTHAAAVRAGLDPRGVARLLQTVTSRPAGGEGRFPREDGRAFVLDARSAGCFTDHRRLDPVTRSAAWAITGVPAPGIGQHPCDDDDDAPSRSRLRTGALQLDRDVAPWSRPDQLVLSPGGEVALGLAVTDQPKAGSALQRLRGRPGASLTGGRGDLRLRLPARAQGGRTTWLDLGVARAVLRLVAADGPAAAARTSAADASALAALLQPHGAGTVLRGTPLGIDGALVGVAADPDDEHRSRVAVLAP